MTRNNSDLRDVCYEQIKDNFYYGLYGDFRLVIDKNTGYFNATKLCNESNKRYRNWARSERAHSLFDYYKTPQRSSTSVRFYEIKGDNNDPLTKKITGQYVRKELILEIASWISVEFYDKAFNIVNHYLVNQFQTMNQQLSNTILEKDSVIAEKVDKIDELREMLHAQGERLHAQEEMSHAQEEMLHAQEERLHTQDEQIATIKTKLDIAIDDRAPKPKYLSKRERFILLKCNNPKFEYYVIRAQDQYAKKALSRQRALFSDVEILLNFHYHPNTKTLYVRVKEHLKDKRVIFNGCHISLTGSNITETELVQTMKAINDEKANV